MKNDLAYPGASNEPKLLTKFLSGPKREKNVLPVPFSCVGPFMQHILVNENVIRTYL